MRPGGSPRVRAREVIAVDGKTLRGSKTSPDGKGALHLVSAYATEAEVVLAQQAVDGKSNEITAIPELLDMLNLKGAIVTIDAMGTQKEIARRIADQGADYVLALKGNRPAFMRMRRCSSPIRSAPQIARSTPRPTPAMAGLKSAFAGPPRQSGSPNAIPTGRICVPSPPSPPGASTRRPARKPRNPLLHHVPRTRPKAILAAARAHWGIENNLHWTMDVTFDEDRCRTRKDASPLNFAVIRHTGYNLLKADKHAAPCAESASEPASTQRSGPTSSPLNDLGFCPGVVVIESYNTDREDRILTMIAAGLRVCFRPE